jgi:ATP-dependent Clp protease ATP-binding subunit ClpC
MVYLGMWQQRCLDIVRELNDSADVLYVDRLADIMQPASDGASIAELIGPAVIGGQLTIVAECDELELVRARQQYPALVDALRIVRVPEATPAQTIALPEPYGWRQTPAVALSHRRRAARRAACRVPARHRVPGKAPRSSIPATKPGARSPTSRSHSPTGPGFRRCSCLSMRSIRGDRGRVAAWRSARTTRDRWRDRAAQGRARRSARLVGTLLPRAPPARPAREAARAVVRRCRAARPGRHERFNGAAIARLITPSLRHEPRGSHSPPAARSLFDEIEKADAAARPPARRGRRRSTHRCARPSHRLRMAVIAMTTNPARAIRAPPAVVWTSLPITPGRSGSSFCPELLGRIDSVISPRPLAPPALERPSA